MNTIADCLAQQAHERPANSAFTFIDDKGSQHKISFQELHLRASAIAEQLEKQGNCGRTAVLLFPQGLDYIEAFFGCLYAGALAVPLYPPKSGKHFDRVLAVLQDCGAAIAITTSALEHALAPKLAPLPLIGSNSILHSSNSYEIKASSSALAFLQYTSGSTGTPKGVMVSHANIMANLAALTEAARCRCTDVFCNWLPLFHDLGLINTLLLPIYLGAHSILMSPARFMQRPLAWLEAISANRATICGAPNFAFDHCISRIQASQLEGLDLSSWRVAFNAAEPIDVRTLRRFAALCASAGFDERAFYPAYGMAEATVFISAGSPKTGYFSRDYDAESLGAGRAQAAHSCRKSQTLVACGRSASKHTIKIVSAETSTELPSATVGEIWFAGPSVTEGYWNESERTRATFGARIAGDGRAYLRTGDLGFIDDGELYISGRIKDILIVKGRNYYPQDLERAACEAFPGLIQGGAVAFEVEGKAVLVQEVARSAQQTFEYERAFWSIQAGILDRAELTFDDIVLIKAGTLPKTSSGKVQRALTKERYVARRIDFLRSLRELGSFVSERPQRPTAPLEERLCTIWEEELGVERIGVTDSFLALGGHSLLASRLVARIRDEWNCDISIKDLFEAQCIRELAAAMSRRSANAVPPLTKSARHGDVPLSYMQQSLWLVDQIEPGKYHYNMFKGFRMKGRLDVAGLDRAFKKLLERHEVLRTTIHMAPGGEPVQVVGTQPGFSLPVVDLTAFAPGPREEAISRHAETESARPFDLAAGLMLRAVLLKLGPEAHVLLITLHHVACDGWSEGILVRELSALYREENLPAHELQYSDYADWQRSWLQQDVLGKYLEYWKTRLARLPVLHSLRLDRPRPLEQCHDAEVVHQILNESVLQGLRSLAQIYDATLFMVLSAALAALLSRHSGEDDIVIGTAIANRDAPELARLVGYFANALVLRVECSGNPPFDAFLRHCKERLLEAFEHQHLPFEKLVDELQPQRDLSHSPLYQIKLVLQNNEPGRWDLPGIAVEEIERPHRVTQHDLNVDVYERAGTLEVEWEFATALWNRSTIERLAEHFEVLINAILVEPRTPLRELAILTSEERTQLVFGWNDTARSYRRGRCIQEVFEDQVRRDPDGIAVISGSRQISYGELSRQSNQVAHYLREQGVGPGVLVGLCVERSVETLIGILGILKAGSAYVPIDPGHPAARIEYVLRDSAIQVVLTEQQLLPVLPLEGLQVLPLDEPLRKVLLGSYHSEDIPPAELGLCSTDLAYVIYTSGSTGEPKGVMLEHEGVCNLAHWQSHFYRVKPQSRVSQFASYSFDGSVGESFMALLNGATLVMLDRQQSPAQLMRSINEYRIETIVLVPSFVKELDPSQIEAGERLTVVAVGEACPVELAQRWSKYCTFCNGYGPTECTVYSHIWTHPKGGSAPLQSVPIGKPIDNITGYILDEHRNPLPVGVVGELYLSGVGLARGYLNRPDLTAEKFVGNPRLYKTGDLAVFRPDGNVEFIGRTDHQIKLRGMRIELGEIESALLDHKDVSEAVVVIRDEPERLVAYVVGNVDPETLREFLKGALPHYMVPAVFIAMGALPLNPIGKVDRNALPEPGTSLPVSVAHAEPRNAVESELCHLWESMLKQDRIGIDNDFFALGGHSLLAVRLIAEVRARFQVDLGVRKIFEHKTIRELAGEIASATAAQQCSIGKAAEGRPLALSFAQRRLWLVDQIEPGNCQYNIPMALRLEGTLDVAALTKALHAIVERHEVLRTTIQSTEAAEAVQVVRHDYAMDLPVLDLTELNEYQQKREVRRCMEEEAFRPFNLSTDLMLRVKLLRRAEQVHVLLITMHHIASDGWSAAILIEEFSALYRAFVAGEPNPLSPPVLQYRDYAAWQRKLFEGAGLDEALRFWKQRLQGLPEIHNLPLDRSRPIAQDYKGAIYHQSLNASLHRGLNDVAQQADCTLFMVLSAAFAVLISRYSNEDDIVIGTPIANREQAELASLVGFFVNALVLRVDLSDNPTFERLLQRHKEYMLGAYEHQRMPFERLVEELQPERHLGYSPLFQVKLALHNNELPELWLPGLSLKPVDQDVVVAKHDLSVDVIERDEGMTFIWEYAGAIFERSTIERMANHFAVLLRGIVEAPHETVGELPLLSPEEQAALLMDWNDRSPVVELREGDR